MSVPTGLESVYDDLSSVASSSEIIDEVPLSWVYSESVFDDFSFTNTSSLVMEPVDVSVVCVVYWFGEPVHKLYLPFLFSNFPGAKLEGFTFVLVEGDDALGIRWFFSHHKSVC